MSIVTLNEIPCLGGWEFQQRVFFATLIFAFGSQNDAGTVLCLQDLDGYFFCSKVGVQVMKQ